MLRTVATLFRSLEPQIHSETPVQIEITTHDGLAAFALLDQDHVSAGEDVAVSDALTVTYQGGEAYKSLGLPEVMLFAVAVAQNLPASVAADLIWTWLSTRLKKRPETLRIEREVVEFEEGAVKRIVRERITREG